MNKKKQHTREMLRNNEKERYDALTSSYVCVLNTTKDTHTKFIPWIRTRAATAAEAAEAA